MAVQTTNYQCPACGGPLHYAGGSGKLECEYCGSTFEVAEIEAQYAEKEAAAEKAAASWNTANAGGEWGEDAAGMKAYTCPSCGAELICDETTAATSCPYCGNPTIVPGQFGGTKKPDFVLPFKLDKDAAKAMLKKHYQKKVLLPKAFSTQNHIEEIKGVYVPFWLFDGKAIADIHFHGTRSNSYRDGDYIVTETEHFDVYRAGSVSFEKIPVDGSTKMPDDYMDSIEPFHYADLKEFSTAYLPGYLADKYDVDANEAAVRADERCRNSARDCMKDGVTSYDALITDREVIDLEQGKVSYALMPVWLLVTKWNGKNYLFAMNGQTGKLVGNLPVDEGKAKMILWSLTVGLTVALSLFLSGPIGRMIAGWLS